MIISARQYSDCFVQRWRLTHLKPEFYYGQKISCCFFCYKELFAELDWDFIISLGLSLSLFFFFVFIISILVSNPSFREVLHNAETILTSISTNRAIAGHGVANFDTVIITALLMSSHRWVAYERFTRCFDEEAWRVDAL